MPTHNSVNVSTENSRTEVGLSILNNTIAVINSINNLIPVEIAKGVLSTVTDILTTVKDFIQNREDFLDLVQQCHKIAGILERAQSGSHAPDDNVIKAITNLQVSVESVQEMVNLKTQDSGGKRLFNVVIDKDNVAGWQKQLDSSLQFFIAEMALATNNALAIRNMADTLRAAEALPDALPPIPNIFFGRTELMDQVILALLNCEHVALIGGGGIGKSSIAAAVLQNTEILKRFNNRRYFVRFDDINPAQITPVTFLDRVSRALGIKSSQVEPHTLISRHLSSSKALVVLDNGESFQDSHAGDPNGRIASSVIDFSNIPGVSILLTTRTATLPFACLRVNVPTLQEHNACAAFMKVYPNFSDPTVLPKLLATLDFHPLSINLLAHAAAQNNASPDDLIKSWEHQKTRLLEQGGGKFQSLAATIGLSLKSPAISALGNAALRLLQAIAFLPQGLYEEHMQEVIPRIPVSTLETAINVLLSHSLIYRNGMFLTMLAPIRLHIAGQDADGIFPVSKSVLADIRTCYFTRVKRPNPQNIDWLKIEDINAEGLIVVAVANSTHKTMKGLCMGLTMPFLQFLQMNKPRATTLRAVILALPEIPDRDGMFLKVFFQQIRDGMNLAAKRLCIIVLAILASSSGQMEEAKELATIARTLYKKHGMENAPLENRYIRVCEEVIAGSYFQLGRLNEAESTLKTALDTNLTFKLKGDWFMEVNLTLLFLTIVSLKGRDAEVPQLVAKVKKSLKNIGPVIAAEFQHATFWSIQLCSNQKTIIEDGKKFCEDIINSQKISYSEDFKLATHLMSIEVALRLDDKKQAKNNLERAQKLEFKKPRPLSILASFTAAVTGDFTHARSLVNRAIADASTQGIMVLSISCLYIAAGIEMHAGDYKAARELYEKIIEDSDVLTELPYKARAKRALGEIAIMEGNESEARERFEEVNSLCKVMGIPSGNLYRDNVFVLLDARFSGWQKFLDSVVQGLVPN